MRRKVGAKEKLIPTRTDFLLIRSGLPGKKKAEKPYPMKKSLNRIGIRPPKDGTVHAG